MTANHIARNPSETVQERINALKIGQKMQDLPEHLWHESFKYYVKEDPNRNGGPNMRMIRLDPNKPSLTVTGFIFNKFVHPFENRFVTVREAARLQGFPDDLEFKGSLTSAQQQVGNAVPVEMAQAVAQSVLEFLAKNTIEKNHEFTGLSLFSGAGGFDIGVENARFGKFKFSTKVAMDVWDDACKTLKSYFPKLNVLNTDITTIKKVKRFWSENSGEVGDLDFLFGGPPCQSFSQAGKQKGTDDLRGQLVFDYVRFVAQLKPKCFVLENVSNLKGVAGGELFKEICNNFSALGYNLDYNILTATDFGSAQSRKRLFILGTRKDIGKAFLPKATHGESPELLPVRTVKEAFDKLPSAVIGTDKARQKLH